LDLSRTQPWKNTLSRRGLRSSIQPPSEPGALDDKAGASLHSFYEEERILVAGGQHPCVVSETDHLRLSVIAAQRAKLNTMRDDGIIDDDVFHVVERDLDFAELAASPPESWKSSADNFLCKKMIDTVQCHWYPWVPTYPEVTSATPNP
jgi:hypothetical protein